MKRSFTEREVISTACFFYKEFTDIIRFYTPKFGSLILKDSPEDILKRRTNDNSNDFIIAKNLLTKRENNKEIIQMLAGIFAISFVIPESYDLIKDSFNQTKQRMLKLGFKKEVMEYIFTQVYLEFEQGRKEVLSLLKF